MIFTVVGAEPADGDPLVVVADLVDEPQAARMRAMAEVAIPAEMVTRFTKLLLC
jgi:hypothetical protein